MNYVKLVEDINQDIYEIVADQNPLLQSFIEENPPLELTSCGYAHSITLFGFNIWCSENDERPYINENTSEEDYLPLNMWIKQEVKRIIALIHDVNICLQGKLI